MRLLVASLLPVVRTAAAYDCSTPLAFEPIPDLHVAIWNTPGPNHDEHHAWPMLGHDVRHTGFYTPPAPDRPANLSVGAGNVLAWEDRSAVEDAYVVERSATGAPWSYQTVATLPPDSTSWAAAPGALYRVRAARGGVRSRPSNAVSVP